MACFQSSSTRLTDTQADRQTDRPKYLGGRQRGTLKAPVMRSAAMTETSSCPELPSNPLESPACHFGDVSRRYSGSISCHRSGCRSILALAPVQPPLHHPPPHFLALVQAPLWLCFGVGFIVAVFQQSLSLPLLPPSTPPSTFSFSTPGSWPPARHADQWEIQAQAFCLGWHFAFVFPSRL